MELPNIAQRVAQLDQQLFTGDHAIRVSSHDLDAFARAARALEQALPEPGLPVGSTAPDFTLGNAFGKPKNLHNALTDGPAVLVFYRGAWCPYCNVQLQALKEIWGALQAHGATVFAITPQTPDKSLEQVTRDGFPFEILSDLDDAVTRLYGLYWQVSPELDQAYKNAFGLDLGAFNGGRLGLPVPATFVVDRRTIIRAVYADVDYKKRMEPADMIATLDRMAR